VIIDHDVPPDIMGMVFLPMMFMSVPALTEPPEEPLLNEDPPPSEPTLPPLPPEVLIPEPTAKMVQVLRDYEWGRIPYGSYVEGYLNPKDIMDQEYIKQVAERDLLIKQMEAEYEKHKADFQRVLKAHKRKQKQLYLVYERALDAHRDECTRIRKENASKISEYYSEVGLIFGDMKDAFPTGINGMPCFGSITFMHKEDVVTFKALILSEIEQAKVSATKIFVGANAGRQLTVYQMESISKGGNAMILPVPTMGDIELSTMETDPWVLLEELFPVPRSRSMTNSRGVGTKSFLKVHAIGDYKVSIADTIADIANADPSVFTLSPMTQKVLELTYSLGFKFLIVSLKENGKITPLVYSFPMIAASWLFIPTRHEHGSKKDAWDHTIYVASDKNIAEGRVFNDERYPNPAQLQAPESRYFIPVTLSPYVHEHLNKYTLTGLYPNTDLTVQV
jgi:hypothetical protein